jgi:predicted heme/steroid binding protein
MTQFTVSELATNDGREGRPAYVAYKGVVYDVTDSPMWAGGDHEDLHKAGRDVTAEHEDAPHDVYVTDFPEVGTLA